MPNATVMVDDVDGAGGGGRAVVGGLTRGKLFWREIMSTRLQNLHVAATLHVAVMAQLNDHQRPRSFDLSSASIITNYDESCTNRQYECPTKQLKLTTPEGE